jgi:hypothetical protein
MKLKVFIDLGLTVATLCSGLLEKTQINNSEIQVSNRCNSLVLPPPLISDSFIAQLPLRVKPPFAIFAKALGMKMSPINLGMLY